MVEVGVGVQDANRGEGKPLDELGDPLRLVARIQENGLPGLLAGSTAGPLIVLGIVG